jgi:hypothetical protein
MSLLILFILATSIPFIPHSLLFYPEDGSSRFPQNIGKCTLELLNVTSQKIVIFIVITMRASDLTLISG